MNVMAFLLWPSKCRLHLLKGLLLPLLRSRFVYMLLIIITMRRVELSKAKRIKSETSCPVCDNYLDSFLQTFKLVHGSSNQLHSALYGPYSLMISTNHEIIIIPHFIMSHFFKSLKYLFQMMKMKSLEIMSFIENFSDFHDPGHNWAQMPKC